MLIRGCPHLVGQARGHNTAPTGRPACLPGTAPVAPRSGGHGTKDPLHRMTNPSVEGISRSDAGPSPSRQVPATRAVQDGVVETGTNFFPTSLVSHTHNLLAGVVTFSKLIGRARSPPSVKLVTLRRLVMKDCRVGFLPATWRPSIMRPADSQPSE